MAAMREIQQAKQASETDLLSKPNVNSVGIGRKRVGGRITDELSIVVFVDEKQDVAEADMVPPEIDGIPTDVVERRIVPMPRWVRAEELERKVDAARYATLEGGMSIGPCRNVFIGEDDVACQGVPGPGNYVFVGTLGMMVRDRATGDDMLLSNFHVMCVDDGWSAGDTMAQPSRVDGGTCPADVVGELTRARLNASVDAAVARRTGRPSACSILGIGDIAGTATPTIGMAVRKRGRTTELTHGTVDVVNLTTNVPYCDGLGTVTLTNQIGIDVDTAQSTVFGQGGDSGSVVVDSSRNVLGLYFAGSPDGTYGVANHIADVLSELDVELCTTIKKIEKELAKEALPKEFKEFLPKEFLPKEFKEIKEKDFKEFKEMKEKDKDLKEKDRKEIKEKDRKDIKEKDFKEDKEKDIIEGPDPVRPPLEQRVGELEAAVAQLSHFISQNLRPDLRGAAFRGERDLHKDAADAQQSKYQKDLEKYREG